MTPEEREATIREITERLAERFRQHWPDEQVPLSEIEDVVGRVGGETLRELTEEMLQEQVRRREGNQSACACGGVAVFRGITASRSPASMDRCVWSGRTITVPVAAKATVR